MSYFDDSDDQYGGADDDSISSEEVNSQNEEDSDDGSEDFENEFAQKPHSPDGSPIGSPRSPPIGPHSPDMPPPAPHSPDMPPPDYGSDSDGSEESNKYEVSENQINEEFDASDDEQDETYLQKFNKNVNKNYIAETHPECIVHNNQEIEALATVYRDETNSIIDDNHKSLPILTKYERTRIIGQRAKQINQGSKAFIDIPEGVIDGYLIAEMELRAKKIPFIIQRPMPNGSKEFWKVEDLEQVDF